MGASEQGVQATSGRWVTVPRTLSLIFNDDAVLLMKRGPHRRIFPNRYNGVGGHIERDEDPLTGAIREIEEETGLAVRDLRLRVICNIDAGADTGIMLFVFTAISDDRSVVDTGEEGSLHWIPVEDVLTLDVVEDLPELWPRILAMGDDDPPLYAHVGYDANDTIQLRFAGENSG